MKAIHNIIININNTAVLFSILQRYKMKAIHNKKVLLPLFRKLFSILQRYKMKAIHNGPCPLPVAHLTVFNTSQWYPFQLI